MLSAIPPPIVAALVAGIVSVIVAVFSFYATVRTVRAERQKLERGLTRLLTERLYDLRLKHYPRAFEITEGLRKYSGRPPESIGRISRGIPEVPGWRASEVSLCISEYSLARFYDLVDALKRHPGQGDEYTDTQVKKTWSPRNRFRGALRVDLGLLFEEERVNKSKHE